jgi:hypothetical protein
MFANKRIRKIYLLTRNESHENYRRWPSAYKKPSNGPSKAIIINRVRVGVKDYQTTQRKTWTCKSISVLLLSVSLLNRRCPMFCRHPWAVSSSDSNILFMIDSIQVRNLIVKRLGKLAGCVYWTIATVLVLVLKSRRNHSFFSLLIIEYTHIWV